VSIFWTKTALVLDNGAPAILYYDTMLAARAPYSLFIEKDNQQRATYVSHGQ
jgi:hypothetical protein